MAFSSLIFGLKGAAGKEWQMRCD
ncbi:hypothetical protein IL54_1599 [Sphingobium sp. ba1]|nr:hypothetical protein IL54_1599 [Sphingobium sp. ba1]